MTILSPGISKSDAQLSTTSVELLKTHMSSGENSLVFFVGAGASISGNTGMPSTPKLLYQLFLDSLIFSERFEGQIDSYKKVLNEISSRLGFEITLNDFWQICREATSDLYSAFAELEQKCRTNRVHTFMACWLARGGTVITTNYDRLIEREWMGLASTPKSRYKEADTAAWQADLNNGGCLFKIHGSLDDPSSCLGALEHVGIQLTGHRADLLMNILQNRPVCFVGWRGVDPDIPPLLHSAMAKRDASLPIFWIHYEGNPPGTSNLENTLKGMSAFIAPLANQHPILTEADRAFGEMLTWLGVKRDPNPHRKPLSFEFQNTVKQCAKTGVTRMVGIALRRAGQTGMAEEVLETSLSLAVTREERSAALEELSLLHQQKGGRRTAKSRNYLSQARRALGRQADPWLQLNTDFGLLSQTVVALKNSPWLLLRIRRLFAQYRQDIDDFRVRTNDDKSAALHEALFFLYRGRLRFKIWGWLGKIVKPLALWIKDPFDTAKAWIGDAQEIHIHAHIDVLAYRAVALADLRFWDDARQDLSEIDRLVAILNDEARTRHWKEQRRRIESLVAKKLVSHGV